MHDPCKKRFLFFVKGFDVLDVKLGFDVEIKGVFSFFP